MSRENRLCYYVDVASYVEGHGYRLSIVEENEPGHCPTGTWPYEGKVGQSMPLFVNGSYQDARRRVQALNECMGISIGDAFEIVTSSMSASNRLRGVEHLP